ncbi:hypothetical protein ACFV2H_25850 [Streptomyces sp. NPDC059629]|uniref:hypothetical protein n=1 Tax=Streptomyces sp. NPDC059629 TaxID=3346889 RepID=UPI0036AA9CC7
MTYILQGPVLEGGLVRLEPLEHRHADDLAVAAEENRGTYGFTRVPRAEEAGGYIDAPGEDGRLRDSAIFSVTAAEWPGCRKRLAERIAGYGAVRPRPV